MKRKQTEDHKYGWYSYFRKELIQLDKKILKNEQNFTYNLKKENIICNSYVYILLI